MKQHETLFYGKMSGKSENKPNDGTSFWSNNPNNKPTFDLNSDGSEFEDEQRLAIIFKQLDRSGNGRIDIQDLTAALKGFGMSTQYAEVSIIILIYAF